MAYVVLARKYRPLQFADLVGQEHVTRTLQNAIEHDRVHHAYLFAGGRGLGKTTTARILAKALVCEHGPTPTPCGQCSHCVAVRSGKSVDVIEIDGASNNRVDDVRNLREQVHYLPQSARRKIYIIDEVHMLTTSAFNALLKTLEEPPPHVNFMFATTEPHKLLPTILSRVSRLDFRRPSIAQLVDYLDSIVTREGLELEGSSLRLVARAANGSVRDALTLLDQVLAFASGTTVGEPEVRQVLGLADAGEVIELVEAIVERDPARALTAFDSILAAGYDLTALTAQILELLRDLTVLALVGRHDALAVTTEGEVERLQTLVAKSDATGLRQLFDRFARVVEALSNSRMPWIALEMGVLDLAHSEPLQPLSELVARLDALAESGGSGSTTGGGSMSSPGGQPQPRPRGGRTVGSPGRSRTDASTTSAAPSTDAHPTPAATAHDLDVSATKVARSTETQDPALRPKDANNGTASAVHEAGPISGRLMDLARARGVISSHSPSDAAVQPPAGAHATARIHAADTGAAPPPRPEAESAPPDPAPAEASREPVCEPCLPAGDQRSQVIPWLELEPFAAWEQLIGRIRQQDELLSAVLVDLGLVGLQDGRLQLAAAPRSFGHRQALRSEVRANLEQALRDHMGATFEIELQEREPNLDQAPSLSLVEASRRAQRQTTAEAEARAHAAIQHLLATFDATLTAVKPAD